MFNFASDSAAWFFGYVAGLSGTFTFIGITILVDRMAHRRYRAMLDAERAESRAMWVQGIEIGAAIRQRIYQSKSSPDDTFNLEHDRFGRFSTTAAELVDAAGRILAVKTAEVVNDAPGSFPVAGPKGPQ